MRVDLVAFAISALILGVSSAQATLMVYTDEASFRAALGGAQMAVEGFETLPPSGNPYPSPLELGALSVVAPSGYVTISSDPRYVTEVRTDCFGLGSTGGCCSTSRHPSARSQSTSRG